MRTEVQPSHLIISLLSLQSICTKKNTGTELIDNAELTRFCSQVREELHAYNDVHRIPELSIILDRFPVPRSYEGQPRLFFFTSLIARMLGLLIGALTILNPLIFIPLLIVWLICTVIATLSLSNRRARISDDMRQIAECSSTAVMLIRNNESYSRERKH